MTAKTPKTFLSAAWNWLLGMAVTVGAVGCMRTGLLLEPYNWSALLLVWALVAFFCCLCAHLRRGALILGITALVSLALLVWEGSLREHLETLIFRISRVYDMAYNCGALNFGREISLSDPLDMGLGLVGCLCAATCAACLCANTGTSLCVLAGFIPLAACMVVNDTPPDEPYLFLLLTAVLLILLTAAVRRRSREDGLRLGALLLVPVVLFVSLTFRIAPSPAFRDGFFRLQETVLAWLQKLPLPDGDIPGNLFPSDNISYMDSTDLANLGPQTQRYYPVMDVTADYNGIAYLRGYAYDEYDGKSWGISYEASYFNLEWPGVEGRKNVGRLTIRTPSALPLRYFPYYPAGIVWRHDFGRGYLVNLAEATEYSFLVTELDDSYFYGRQAAGSSSLIQAPAQSARPSMRLPEDTMTAAKSYLARHGLTGGTERELALRICKHVSQVAEYDLKTPKMPGEEADFALWFLERSDTGYCVHFATATAVLLRAAGIPARYVTGYARSVSAGATLSVNASHAHAWVEYYDSVTKCWRPLDPTPTGFDSTNPGTEYDVDPLPTEPPVTEAPPTEPPTEPPVTETPPIGQTVPPVTETRQPETGGQTTPTAPGQPTPGRENFPWAALLIIPVLVILPAAQYFLRRLLRQKKFAAGNANARALALWQEADRYALALKKAPPEDLRELAEKARFSQHMLTDGELAQFDAHLAKAKTALKQLSLPRRIFWQLLLAIE